MIVVVGGVSIGAFLKLFPKSLIGSTVKLGY
jgi:hypothetical protein